MSTNQLEKKARRAVERVKFHEMNGNPDGADIQRYRLWNLCERIAAASGLVGVVATAQVFNKYAALIG